MGRGALILLVSFSVPGPQPAATRSAQITCAQPMSQRHTRRILGNPGRACCLRSTVAKTKTYSRSCARGRRAQIYTEEGVLRFWRGFSTYYGRCAPHAMIILLVREQVRSFHVVILVRYKGLSQRNPGRRAIIKSFEMPRCPSSSPRSIVSIC